VAAHPRLEREACRPASIAALWIVSEWFPVAVTDPPYSVVLERPCVSFALARRDGVAGPRYASTRRGSMR